jgi:cytoskeletal protein CcmA (bactofilin family)
MNHFDEMTGLLCLEGQLDAAHAQEVRAHAATCAACRELLHALESEGVWLRKALEEDEESVPARLMEAPARGGAPWGWITGLGFAAGGIYTVWSSFIEPVRVQAEQAGFSQGNLLTMLFFSGAFWKGWDAMRSLMEFLAIATLGTIVIWLLRRHLRRVTTFAVMMGAIAFALTMPPSAMAGETRHGDPNYTLRAGEEIKTDLIVFADNTRIEGDVDGDLLVWSRNITVSGHIKGDIIGFGQEIRISGPVDGNVRAWAQTLSISSTIARNVTAWTEATELEQKARVGGSLMSGSSDVESNGAVAGDFMAGADTVEIGGSLGRNAKIRSSRLTFGSNAEVKGQVQYRGRHEAEVATGAKLGSPIDFTQLKEGPDYQSARFYWHQLLFWGASLLFGIVLLLLAPGFFFDAQTACNRYGLTTGFGILFLLATPIAAVVLCITVVGIGLGVSALFLYVIALYATQIFVSSWLGEKILGASQGIAATIGRLALGLAIIHAVKLVPYLHYFVASVVLVWGMGAMVVAVYKNLRPVPAAA